MTAISATPTFPPIGSATFNADAYAWAVHMAGTFTAEVNAAISAMTAIAAGGAVSLQYTFSTTTTDADPGAGTVRLDAATQNTATTIRADLAGSDGSDLSGVLALFDDSTSTNKGYLTIRHSTTPTKWIIFTVASVASPSGYKNITVTPVASSAANPFTNGDAVLLDFTPTGDKGDIGATGTGITPQTVGFTLSGGTTSKTLTVDVDLTASAIATKTGAETLTNKTLTAPAIGTPASGNLSSCTADGTDEVGFRNVPQNSKSAAYTTVLADKGKHILHPSADTTARTFTIDSNANVDYPIGTAITFVNQASAGVMTIAITSDTMRLAGAGTTGSRTLAANGVATALKLTATEWIISGTGLT